MPHHLLAYVGSVAQNAVLANIPTVNDQYFSQYNNGYTHGNAKRPAKLYVRGDSMTAVQLNSPELRSIGPPAIWPFDTAAAIPNLPPIVELHDSSPIIKGLDPFNIQVSRGGAGAAVCQGLAWMVDRTPEPVSMPVRTVRWTSAITSTTTGWTGGAITFDQALPTGRYAVLGMAVFGANLVAARLVFPNQNERPGVLAQEAVGDFDTQTFRYGAFGEFGRFHSTALPTLETLAYGANTSQTGFLDLVPLDGQG